MITILIHNGIRPDPANDFELVHDSKYRKRYFESYPEGGGKFWDDKLLNSGCNNVINEVIESNGLIFCPYCSEWCSESQFEDIYKGDE